MSSPPLPKMTTLGEMLKYLRRRARLTQRELSMAVGYSEGQISRFERNERIVDAATLQALFVPALGLEGQPVVIRELLGLAAGAPMPVVENVAVAERGSIAHQLDHESLTNLPTRLTSFVGREAAVISLRQLIPATRLVTLTGVGGVGKTSLALVVGSELLSTFGDGLWWVELASLMDGDLLPQLVAATFTLPEPRKRTHLESLTTYLQARHLLLILDNCEHLIDSCAKVVDRLLRSCPQLHILTTSREALRVEGEVEWPVLPLATPKQEAGLGTLSTEEMIQSYEAVRLFIERARVAQPTITWAEQNAAPVALICRQLDGIPLAIELAASRLKGLTVDEIAARLDHRFHLLSSGTGARTALPRHQTLRSTLDWSYNLLSEEERALFRRLSVFSGGWTLAAAEAIAETQSDQLAPLRNPVELLLQLVNRSLVVAEPQQRQTRYRLLETMREYATEKLQELGEADAVRALHYATYLQHFRSGDSYLRGPEAATWLARMEAEQDNLRIALQWALSKSRYTDAAWLLLAAHWFWSLHGQWVEGGKWYALLLPHRQELDADLRLAIVTNVLGIANKVEEMQPFDRYTDEIDQLQALCPDKLLQAVGCFFTGYYSADFTRAAALLEQGIALVRAAGEAPGLGPEFCWLTDRDFWLTALLWQFAEKLIEQGEFARATPLVLEYQKNGQARGSRYEMADSLGALGRLAWLQGDLAQAHSLLEEAVTIATPFNYADGLGPSQSLLGLVTLYRGDAAEARRLLNESLRHCLELRANGYLARVCAYLAELALWEGALDQAEQWLAQSLAYDADPQRLSIDQAERLWMAGRLATAQQQFVRAATLFGLAEQVRRHTHYELVDPVRSLAETALATLHKALGTERFADAYTIGQQLSLDKAFATILAPDHFTNTTIRPIGSPQ